MPPSTTGASWVAVAGPPGSGGEAIARALACLGLHLVESGATPTIPSQPSADTGGPVLPLSVISDVPLDLLEGTWWAPPDRPSGWEHRPELASAAPPLVASLEAALRVPRRADSGGPPEAAPAVWYDPRHLLTLPFWRAHQGGVRASVVTWRHPGATVDELGGRRLSTLHAIALWEASLVEGLAATAGLPVLGVDVDAAVDDPDAWAKVAAGFVASLGVEVDPDAEERSAALLRSAPELTVSPHRPDDAEEGASAERMASRLAAVAGFHRCWIPPEPNVVGRWPAALLDAQLASHRSARGVADAWALADANVKETHSAIRNLDWAVDQLTEAMASRTPRDGGAVS